MAGDEAEEVVHIRGIGKKTIMKDKVCGNNKICSTPVCILSAVSMLFYIFNMV